MDEIAFIINAGIVPNCRTFCKNLSQAGFYVFRGRDRNTRIGGIIPKFRKVSSMFLENALSKKYNAIPAEV
jgi:hypothetical protein